MSNEKLHVLIIGAGIGGLTLAQALRKQGISFEIFERDASPSARGQGYALGLYDLDNLFGSSLPSDLPPLHSTCHLLPLPLPSQVIYYFPGGKKLMIEDTPSTPCLRVNRLRLRELLATHIPVRWGKQAIPSSIAESDTGVTVFFADGTSASGTILVGADGVWSAVRPYVLKQPNEDVLEPFSSAVILGELKLDGEVMEAQLRMGHTGWIAFGQGYTLFSGLNRVNVDAEGRVSGDYYWVMGNLEHGDVKGFSREQKLAFAREKVGGLAEEFRVTVEMTKADDVKDNFGWWDALIPGSRLPSVNRVLLIGDACHPMTPNRGEGGIFAIRDAVQLSKLLAENNNADFSTLQTKLDEFQKDVADKGHESILSARDIMNKARAGTTPKAWGHDLWPIDEVKPLPFKLSEWKAQA
ncbi:FAD-dependent urate hydroxylase [Podospora aff. communis PSN243]|uniref:FAD-dependent urate hydroxylase n=1 Tax=Podospora aff. communis PSN243 TaxID=3040156 RepID=A0AAV9GCC7_9PEZI|nr:FAD-dependent urate hydroxylase [Podospora aff. communis PSN243]